MIIQFEVAEMHVSAAVGALLPFAASTPLLLASQSLPEEIIEAQEFEERAQKIAEAVRPNGNQPMRKEALEAVLLGHDTFWDQQGTPDPALRNAVGAFSKALKPFSIFTSPLDLICTRVKHYDTTGPFKGKYLGTRYVRTALGTRVRDILKQKGVLGSG